MGSRRHRTADLAQMEVHGLAVGVRHHQGSADGAFGPDGAEEVGPFVAAVARRVRPRADAGPDAGQGALLADPGLVLTWGFACQQRFCMRSSVLGLDEYFSDPGRSCIAATTA